MKLLCGILLIALTVSDVWTLPARSSSPQDDAEVIAVPRPVRPVNREPTDFRDFVDTGAENPFLQTNPSSFHFNLGFANTFDDLFRRLRTRLWPIAVDSGESGSGDGESKEDISPLGFGLRPLNAKNGNTTSTVKVVDGHKVEINETVYGDSNSLFKVRLVNVRPLESGEEVAEGVINNQGDFKPVSSPSTSAPPKRSELQESDEDDNDRREPLEKQPKDNEVRDIDELKSTNSTKKLDSSLPIEDTIAEATENRQQTAQASIMADPMEQLLEVQQQEEEKKEEQMEQLAQDADTMAHNEQAETETEMPLYDSENLNENFGSDNNGDSNANSELKFHREREEFESSDDEDANAGSGTTIEMSDTFNDEWATLEADDDDDAAAAAVGVDATNDLNNHIDVFESFVPVENLSNDIAVNDIAAANPNFPYNPDAELFEPMPAFVVAAAMPKFEKLSLTPPKSPKPLMK